MESRDCSSVYSLRGMNFGLALGYFLFAPNRCDEEMMYSAAKRILRLPSVQARTGLSRSTIYLRIAEGSFPKQISLGARAIGWIEGDIDAWIDTLIAEHHSALPQSLPAESSRRSRPASHEISASTRSRTLCCGKRVGDDVSAR